MADHIYKTKVYYEDTDYQLFDATVYKEKIVKVIVKQKTDVKQFEKFIDKLGSKSWDDKKNRAKKKTDDIAKELLKNHAARGIGKSNSLSPGH